MSTLGHLHLMTHYSLRILGNGRYPYAHKHLDIQLL